MRVVLDTNVLVSATHWRGICFSLVKRLFHDLRYVILTSEPLASELRDKLVTKFEFTEAEADKSLKALADRATIVQPLELPTDSCRDPDDLVVLGTALAGRADCIVTGDKDLLVIKTFRGIDIVHPADFLGDLERGRTR